MRHPAARCVGLIRHARSNHVPPHRPVVPVDHQENPQQTKQPSQENARESANNHDESDHDKPTEPSEKPVYQDAFPGMEVAVPYN
jgi:hypothetical protein